MRILIGIILSVVAISLLFTFLAYLGSPPSSRLEVASWFLVLSALGASFVMVIMGLPMHFILSKINKSSAFWYGLSGVLIGALTGAFIPKSQGFLYMHYLIFGILGVLGALTFWAIAVKKPKKPNPSFKRDA